jgi:glycosyltransferase involved in cell wall biosynthesis
MPSAEASASTDAVAAEELSRRTDPGDPTPRVSVGLIVYNGERYLESSIASLLAQTYRDFELIISDNGSTDDTERIARAAAAGDSRVRYARSETNKGVAWNLNNAARLARGDYFVWASHDDLHSRDFLERCVGLLDADPGVVYVYATTYLMDGDGHVFGREANRFTLGARAPDRRFWEQLVVRGGQNFYGMIRGSTLRSIGAHGRTPWAERVMFGELSLNGRFAIVPGARFYWRRHSGQLTEVWDSRRQFALALDPARPAWRRSSPALIVEYVAGYVGAIQRAPLSARERLRCYARLGRWLVGHVPGLAVRDPRTLGIEIVPAGPEDQLPPDEAASAGGRSSG